MAITGLRRTLKGVAAASALAVAATGAAHANFDIGLAAYEQGQYDVALDVWTRFAKAGDVRSMKILGDVYSGKALENARGAEIPLETNMKVDNVEALRWYTLAAYHRFNAALKTPTAQERNAQIIAEERLPDIRFRMSDAQVNKAEQFVADTFQRGSPHDIYALGDMYRRGAGVKKNNVKALAMYEVAKTRGVNEASFAYEDLEKLMTPKQVEMAHEQFVNWQPPLPEEHTGKTPQMLENERLKKELEELRLEDALAAVSDIDVELIQRALKSLGFYFGSVDNAMGPQTRAAIRKFQYSQVKLDTEMTESDKELVKTGVLSAKQTVELFATAADKAEHPMSQYVYGVMHVRGIGVEQNGETAVSWLKKAASEDLAIAHYALGVVYRDGTTGLNPVTPNKADAALHFARSQALGFRPAAEALRLLSFEEPRSVE